MDQAVAYKLLDGATVTGPSGSTSLGQALKNFQAAGRTTAGAGAAAIDVEGRNSDLPWEVIGTISLVLGTADTSDSFQTESTYTDMRFNVTSISGTGASVDAAVGI